MPPSDSGPVMTPCGEASYSRGTRTIAQVQGIEGALQIGVGYKSQPTLFKPVQVHEEPPVRCTDRFSQPARSQCGSLDKFRCRLQDVATRGCRCTTILRGMIDMDSGKVFMRRSRRRVMESVNHVQGDTCIRARSCRSSSSRVITFKSFSPDYSW